MLLAGDERKHNNPDKAYVDAEFIRGGGRVSANLQTLLTDFVSKTDQLKENITTVYVISERIIFRLKSIPHINSLTDGWQKETVDLTEVNSRLDTVESDKANLLDVIAGDNAVTTQLLGTAPSQADTLGKLYSMLQGMQLLINGDDVNLDSIKELADAIKSEQSTIDALIANKLNKLDVYNALDQAIEGKALDARQGKALAELISVNATAIANFVTGLNGKVDKITGKQLSTEDYTTADRNKVTNVPADTVSSLANKVDKVTGKQLSTNDYTTDEKNKLGSILSGFNILFTAPRRDLPAVYFDKAVKIIAISLNGASAFSYSLNNGTSYTTPTLPLTTSTAITLPVTTFVRFRITFASNSTDATAYLKFE